MYFFETAIDKEHFRKVRKKIDQLSFFVGITNTGLNKASVILCICFSLFKASISVCAFGIMASSASWSSNRVCLPFNLWSAGLIQLAINRRTEAFTLTKDKSNSNSPLDFNRHHFECVVGFNRRPSSFSLALLSLGLASPTMVIHPCVAA